MTDPAPDFEALFGLLKKYGVRFVVIGGLSCIYHGHSRVTFDADLCYARDDQNLKALARALSEMKSELRGVPPGLPFRLDAATLKAGLNFTFKTCLGDLDVLVNNGLPFVFECIVKHFRRYLEFQSKQVQRSPQGGRILHHRQQFAEGLGDRRDGQRNCQDIGRMQHALTM